MFVMECIQAAWGDEIRWPTADERRSLGEREPMFKGCIGMIDGTLIRISRPSNLQGRVARRYYSGRKKIYAMNCTVVVDHDGLFIYVDGGYPGSYHDVTILKHSRLYRRWRRFFTRDANGNYFEYLIGDRKCSIVWLII